MRLELKGPTPSAIFLKKESHISTELLLLELLRTARGSSREPSGTHDDEETLLFFWFSSLSGDARAPESGLSGEPTHTPTVNPAIAFSYPRS